MKKPTHLIIFIVISSLFFTSCSTLKGLIGKFLPDGKPDTTFVRMPSMEKKLLQKTNAFRKKNDRAALSYSDYLDGGTYKSVILVGKKHQKTKKTEDGQKHRGFKKFNKKAFKGGWKKMAENLGWSQGRNDSDTVDYFFKEMVNSEYHKKNMLGETYNFTGITVVKIADYYYFVQRFGQY